MCIATFIPANIDIPWQGLENGAITNDDGHGFAIASKQGLEVYKSMSYDLTALNLAAAREKHGPASLVLFHSRFATHGTTNEFNVHPFYVQDETVMCHNGILPMQWHPTKGDNRSDTRIFADTVGRQYSTEGVPSRRAGKKMGDAIGRGNKLIFLTAKDGQPKVRIVNAHMGEFTQGVWFSNTGYLPATTRWTSWYKDDVAPVGGGWFSEDDDGSDLPTQVGSGEVCSSCHATGTLDYASDTCVACEVCMSCHQWMGDCLCYTSRSSSKEIEVHSPLNPTFVS